MKIHKVLIDASRKGTFEQTLKQLHQHTDACGKPFTILGHFSTYDNKHELFQGMDYKDIEEINEFLEKIGADGAYLVSGHPTRGGSHVTLSFQPFVVVEEDYDDVAE